MQPCHFFYRKRGTSLKALAKERDVPYQALPQDVYKRTPQQGIAEVVTAYLAWDCIVSAFLA